MNENTHGNHRKEWSERHKVLFIILSTVGMVLVLAAFLHFGDYKWRHNTPTSPISLHR